MRDLIAKVRPDRRAEERLELESQVFTEGCFHRWGLSEACNQAFEEARNVYAGLEIRGKNLKERADKFLAAATTVDEKTGTTLLQPLLQAEAMTRLEDVRLLRLKTVTGGATTYTRTTWFSTSVGVGGGAVVSYMLIDGSTGKVIASGTVSEYGGFVEPTNLGAPLTQ